MDPEAARVVTQVTTEYAMAIMITTCILLVRVIATAERANGIWKALEIRKILTSRNERHKL